MITMTTGQMFFRCILAIVLGHHISPWAVTGVILVTGVLFYQIKR